MWMFGPDAAQPAQALQPLIEAPVAASPVEFEPAYWAAEAAKLRRTTARISSGWNCKSAPAPDFRAGRGGRHRADCRGLAGRGLVLNVLARQEAANQRNSPRARRAVAGPAPGAGATQRRTRRQGPIDQARAGRPASARAGLGAGLLERSGPPELVVTNFQVHWEADVWGLQLAGTCKTPSGDRVHGPGRGRRHAGGPAGQRPVSRDILKRSDRPSGSGSSPH